MSEEKHLNQKKKSKMFPYLQDKKKLLQLKIDIQSIHFISYREHADKITKIIKQHIIKLNNDYKETIITDCTSGVGGNVISFAITFKLVNAIEIDKLRCQYLKNNSDIYELKNIKIYNDDCTKILDTLDNHDVIFLDIPWGNFYKKYDNLRLNFGNQSIENFCLDIMNEKIMKKIPKLIVLKLPKNYDILHFYKVINLKNKNIYFYDLKKMIILVIII